MEYKQTGGFRGDKNKGSLHKRKSKAARKMWRQIDRTEKDQSSTKGKALETHSIGPLSDLSRLVWLNFCVAPKVGPRWALHFFRVLETVMSPEGSSRMPVSVGPSWPFSLGPLWLGSSPLPFNLHVCVVCCCVLCVVCILVIQYISAGYGLLVLCV
jgi:hypothetical protein